MQSKFERQLRGLARAANRDMLAESYELYDLLVLEPHGDEVASAALLHWVRTNQRGTFPTPGELLAIITPQMTPRAEAAELASRLMGMIARRGYTWAQTFHYDGHATFEDAVKNELGGAALAFVARLGGWSEVCRQFGGNEAPSAIRAQLRDSLEGLVAQEARSALLGEKREPVKIGPPRGAGGLVRVGQLTKGVQRE